MTAMSQLKDRLFPGSEREEGAVAKTIEKQTARLPSDMFLWAAFGSMGVSAALQLSGRREESLFVGQWAPAFLLLGIYNKIVKVAGSERGSESVMQAKAG